MAARPLALLCVLALAGCPADPRPSFPHALLTPAPTAVPDVPLVGMDGRPWSLARLAGRWVWLYFGYTHCPDVCPATLGQLATAYRALKAPRHVQVVFVSVDPERDKAADLKKAMGYYDADFLAATGSAAALTTLASAVGAKFSVDPTQQHDVSHPNLVYVLDPQGRLAAVYLPDAPLQMEAAFAAEPTSP